MKNDTKYCYFYNDFKMPIHYNQLWKKINDLYFSDNLESFLYRKDIFINRSALLCNFYLKIYR